MKFQIGAMSVGDILDRAVRILVRRLVPIMVIMTLVSIPEVGMGMLLPRIQNEMLIRQNQAPSDPTPVIRWLGFVIALLLVSTMINSFRSAAVLRLVTREFLGEPAKIGDALLFALRRFGPLLWTDLLFGLVLMCIYLGIILPTAIVAVIAFMAQPVGGVLLGFVGFCTFVTLAAMLIVWFIFKDQIVVVENTFGTAALGRSRDLTKGFRWRVFGVFLLTCLLYGLYLVLSLTLQYFLQPVEMIRVEGGMTSVINPRTYAIVTTISYLIASLVNGFTATCWTLFYYDLRIRKEGFDLQMALKPELPEPV